ncbi:MAG: hypothetical protein ACP5P4_05205 [Steroidobacteraceae bacterium]
MAEKEHNANYGSGTKKVDTPSGHLSANARHETPASQFGLPEERKYPLNHGRAGNAKARASEEERKGHITSAQKDDIDRRADKVLKHGDADFEKDKHPRDVHGVFKENEVAGEDAFRGPRDMSDFAKFGPPLGDSIADRQSRGAHVSGRDLARARDALIHKK